MARRTAWARVDLAAGRLCLILPSEMLQRMVVKEVLLALVRREEIEEQVSARARPQPAPRTTSRPARTLLLPSTPPPPPLARLFPAKIARIFASPRT